jgi:hypothetical protein
VSWGKSQSRFLLFCGLRDIDYEFRLVLLVFDDSITRVR